MSCNSHDHRRRGVLVPAADSGGSGSLQVVDNSRPGENDTVVFTVSVTNYGAGSASGVGNQGVAAVRVDAHLFRGRHWELQRHNRRLVDSEPKRGIECDPDLTARVNAGQARQTIENCATLSASTPGDTNAANNQACAPSRFCLPIFRFSRPSILSCLI